ncbi:MAG: hypothetical protein B7Y88_04190 [Sphingomonadales bacterium 32-64-17]|nr:MAG: hypothetical protein B7Y88_04190 [Sphingomonadales bacterium 32-64-17]
MEYTEDGKPKGFDPEHDISLSQAVDVVMHMHPSAKPLTVRKFLIGIAVHDNESGICGYAARFEESYVRIDRPDTSPFRAPPDVFVAIPSDFWRIGMAINNDARSSFEANNLGHITEVTASELPYRMRDKAYGDLQNERVNLTQFAWGVHFPKNSLMALAEDPQWQAWGDVALALQNRGRRGRPPAWKWDEVKAALTIEAAQNPEILNGGAGPIVQFINYEMRQRHYEQIPDRKDVDAFVRHFSWLWAEDEPPP